MANMDVQDYDVNGAVIGNPIYEDGLLTLAGADEIAANTILARNNTTGKFILFVPAGTGDEIIPVAITTIAVSAAGAGDSVVRPLISGEVRKDKIIVDNGATVDNVIADALRDFSIIVRDASDLSVPDNQ